ncbi:type III polyketide synthase [Marivirga atlantica]|jgi:predicted naringenin-chalcone synthase|uniref:Type III polyketide synthase n=1 Tax=Marivirga atlantica TaxID=1548457 RepID=A0A937AI69_9BACT|nr:type III polyketide synthase [Marivirga atlantica]MBL0764053.1 type III polyketide synthase [Marivirga atlantica]
MPYIQQISTAVPNHPIDQKDIANFMVKGMSLGAEEERKLRAVFRLSGIQSRHSVISDYEYDDDSKWTFYPTVASAKQVSTEERMKLFEQAAFPLMEKTLQAVFEKQKKEDFTHLITVSCTGMFAPGLDIQLIKKYKLNPTIERTAIQFMGCFAAINALKTANHICKSEKNAKVLIVCVELCTIHFQSNYSEDNLLANTIFGDGAAAVVVGNDSKGLKLSIEGFKSLVDGNSEDEMAWHISNYGFQMKLSAYVPDVIESKIKELAEKLIHNYQLTFDDIKHFAIHPGGKRILEAVEKGLSLNKEANEIAFDVFRKYGNMSSPTILFVLEELAKKSQKGERTLGFAFGPGLSMESMLLKAHD